MTQQDFFQRYTYSVRTDKLGGGTFGDVYRAYDNVLNKYVAIKVAKVITHGNKEFSLSDEFESIKGLPDHVYIAKYEQLYTYETPQGIFDYAIIQYYPDGNLNHLIKNEKLEQEQKEDIARQILEGLAFLHSYRVVHRDMKPSNILMQKHAITEKYIVKIADFGLSKKASLKESSRFTNSFGGGTMEYSSPEQLRGEALRFNTDLWAWAVIVYELFTGNMLFQIQGNQSTDSAKRQADLFEEILTKDLTVALKELSPQWQEALLVCLERNPDQRVKTAREIQQILHSPTAQTPLKTEPITGEETIINTPTTATKKPVENHKKTSEMPLKTEPTTGEETIINTPTTATKKPVENHKKTSEMPLKTESTNGEETILNTPETPETKPPKPPHKNKKRLWVVIAILTAIALFLAGGLVWKDYKEKREWQQAQQEKQAQKEKQAQQEKQAWQKTKKEHTIRAYQNFAKQYPQSSYTQQVEQILQTSFWEKTFGGKGNNWVNSFTTTPTGDYLIAGWTGSKGAGGSDAWLIKTDKNGNKLWDKTFGGEGWDRASSVTITPTGDYLIAGGKGSNAWLIKTDKNGNKLWDKTFGGKGADEAHSVTITPTGDYLIAGETNSKGSGSYDVWLIKTDKNGNKLWDKTFGGGSNDVAYSVTITPTGDYLIAGETNSKGAGLRDVWLIKTDKNGNKIWDKTFGGEDWDIAHSVTITPTGDYLIAGWTESKGAGGSDAWLIKTDKNGNKIWDKTFGGKDSDGASSVTITPTGDYLIAGSTYSKGAGDDDDAWLIKTDKNGNKIWDKTFGGEDWDGAYSVTITPKGEYLIAGYTRSKDAGERDAWLIKTDKNGEIYVP